MIVLTRFHGLLDSGRTVMTQIAICACASRIVLIQSTWSVTEVLIRLLIVDYNCILTSKIFITWKASWNRIWVFTRRPASADRTARRQFQVTGQPVSRTLVTQWRHGCRAMRRSVCNAGASNGGRSPCVQISREQSYPLPIYWYHSKGNWLRYKFAADIFI